MRLAEPPDVQVAAVLSAYCGGCSDPIGVGVSGGSDSLALLLLTHEWAVQQNRRIIAFTVNHGLRPEAADEAKYVADICNSRGVAHRTLQWSPPEGRATQAKARRARHALLATALREAGGSHLLLGHTEEDQAETVAMRQRAGASKLGLAGMRTIAPSPVWPEGRGIALVRPLMACSRSGLRDWLTRQSQSWIDDPSNTDRSYERVRVRAALSQDQARHQELLDIAKSQQIDRAQMDQRLTGWLGKNVDVEPDGTIRFDPGHLSDEDLTESLAVLIMAAAGTDHRPHHAARLDLARDILSGDWRARTLGGAWIAPRKGRVAIARDPGEAAKASAAGTEVHDIWDGRFEITSKLDAADPDTIWKPGDVASPMARDTTPKGLSSTQIAICLVKARIQMTKYLLEQDSLPL
ncbi:MAG: tRNA lysidine(34) synthetase TilS [Pseudomonadota bacterium]